MSYDFEAGDLVWAADGPKSDHGWPATVLEKNVQDDTLDLQLYNADGTKYAKRTVSLDRDANKPWRLREFEDLIAATTFIKGAPVLHREGSGFRLAWLLQDREDVLV